jgi:aryl-alcohol dehydrogenase-like predicted oxidoreductase
MGMGRRLNRARRRLLGIAGGLAAGGALLPLSRVAAAEAAAPPVPADAGVRVAAPVPPETAVASVRALERPIPSTGERRPAVGLGTAVVLDVGDDAARRAPLAAVLRALVAGGGRLVDTGSTYGSAESVLGDLVAVGALRPDLFIATKLESPDEAELERSLARLRMPGVDLLQLHNVGDPSQSLARFRAWKAQGRCRYVGITSTYHRQFPALASVLAREKPDFVMVDYSIDNREAEKRLLPLAADTGAAVLIALPFGRARLFRAVRGKPLPEWAGVIGAESWAQFFLKFLLGDPRVTCVIPGTADARHMVDNLGAAHGPLPDAAMRARMAAFVQNL